MKYLKYFEDWNTDSYEIQKLIPELNIGDIITFKKDSENSKLYNIIKNYFNFSDKQDIMKTTMKFIQLNYPEVLNNYKQSLKKSFIPKPKLTIIDIPFDDTTLKVPSRIGHNYTPIKAFSIEKELNNLKNHRRFRVFYHKGLKCVSCPNIGKYIIRAKDKYDTIHVDLYTKDFKLMTIDHIKPKSKGGSDKLNNLNPMCVKCNLKKSDIYEEELNTKTNFSFY